MKDQQWFLSWVLMAGIDLYIAGGLTVTDESMKNIHGVCMKDIKKKTINIS